MGTNDPQDKTPPHKAGTTDATVGRAGDDHAGPTADNHAGPTGVNPAALRDKHEPDHVDVRGILLVPAVIVVVGFLCYIAVTLIFGNFLSIERERPKNANDLAAKRSQEPLRDRLKRINSTDPNAEIPQPLLEGARQLQGNDPPWFRSRLPAAEGNSPEYHPEDLRADRWPELNGKAPEWVDQQKGLVRIPIERAMELAAKNKSMLPVQEKTVDPNATTTAVGRPKASNSGRGIPGTPEAKKDQAAQKENGKAETKKEEGKEPAKSGGEEKK
jgi:hypothetical protein